jgi:hypothetical protein
VILRWCGWYASVPTVDRGRLIVSVVAQQKQNPVSLTKAIDRLERMREQMLTLQREFRAGGVRQRQTANSEAHYYEIEDHAVLVWYFSLHLGHSIRSKSPV